MMRQEDRELLEDLLLKVLVLAILVALVYLCLMGLERWGESRQTVGVVTSPPRTTLGKDEASRMADATIIGCDTAVPDGLQSYLTNNDHVKGALYPAGGGPPTVVGSWDAQGTLWPNWPQTLGEQIDNWSVGHPPTVWLAYDPATCQAVEGGARLRVVEEEPPEPGPPPSDSLMLGVYDAQENLVGHSYAVSVHPGDEFQQIGFELTEALTINPETSYYLVVWAEKGSAYFYVGLRYGHYPVSFSEKILVRDVLRLAVRFNEAIPVSDSLRVGVSFREAIPISEELKARLKPSPETGFCFGHHVSDEDAGGTFQ